MKRRIFTKALISSIGLSAIGDKSLLANTRQIISSGNNWSAKGLKIGISHQSQVAAVLIDYAPHKGVSILCLNQPYGCAV